MMNKNQSSRFGLATYALVIPLILLCMVFSYAFAQDKPVIDTVKRITKLQLTDVQQKPEKTPDKALIILDGKVIDKATMDAMNPDDIYTVNVLKGKDATAIYGRKGKNGVVLITSKKPGNDKTYSITYRLSDSALANQPKPLFIINGKEKDIDFKDIDPHLIKSVTVLKDSKSTAIYGDKGKKGVVLITLKDELSAPTSDKISTGTSGSGDETGTKIIVNPSGSNSGGRERLIYHTDTYTQDGKKVATRMIKVYPNDNLIIIDGKEGKMSDVKDEDIEHIEFKQSTAAKAIYGEKAANGVIFVTTKDGKTVTESTMHVVPDNVYVLIDGKEGKISDVKKENIESVSVLKGESAKALYGDKAAKGVILITTKKGGKSTNNDKK